MTKEIIEQYPELNSEILEAIEKNVAALKEADPKLRVVFPIVVIGEEYDDKPHYIAYFKQPSFTVFSKYLSAAQSNSAVGLRALAKDCFLDGDKELVDDDSLFLFGLMGRLGQIIEMRSATIVNLSRLGK